MNEIVRTRRLELRPTRPDMFPEMWAAIESSLPQLAPWMPWAVEAKPQSTRDFLDRAEEKWTSGLDRPFTIFKDGELCGQCSLDRVDRLVLTCEIGYWMRSDLCGQGFMTEAAAAVVDYGFRSEGMYRIELHAGIDNAASIRVAQKLGFQREGIMRGASLGAGGRYDLYVYGLLATDPSG